MENVTRLEPARQSYGEPMDPWRWQCVCPIFATALRCSPTDRDVLLREANAGGFRG